MPMRTLLRHALPLFLLLWLAAWECATAVVAVQEVRIGVLARRGSEQALRMWSPTAEYLDSRLPGRHFVIVPIDFDALLPTVKAGGVDFILANSSYYVEMESRYGVSRIATLRNRDHGGAYTKFGGVIFTRADRTDIQTLADLRGKSFMAVDAQSLGGWRAAWRELKQAGIDPYTEFKPLRFGGTHDAVVYAVQDGVVDAGTVRTDTLERMAQEGKIDVKAFRVIAPQEHSGFTFLCSTRLYPEWPLARLKNTSEQLAHDVATALLQMPPDSDAALRSKSAGWTIPANYQPVHDLLRELRVGPYRGLGKVSVRDMLRQYWPWFVVGALAFLVLLGVVAYIARLNARLRLADGALRQAHDQLEQRVETRTMELRQALAELEESRHRIELTQRDWHDAFDAIPHPIFIHDKDMRIVHANPAYLARAGMEVEEIVGRPYWEVFPRVGGPLPACRQFPDKLHTRGDEVELETGEVFVSQSFGVRHQDGSIRHAIHIMEDVTAERNAEAQRRTLSHAVAQAGEGIMLVGLDLKVTYCNPALCGLLGGIAAELQGQTVEMVFPTDVHAQLTSIVEHASMTEGWMGEMELVTVRGHRIPVFLTASSIRNERNERIGYVFTVMDLTSVKQAEEMLRYRIAFESLISSLATHFVSVSGSEVDTEIDQTLGKIGTFVGAERGYMFTVGQNGERISDVHEWCAQGVSSIRQRFEMLNLSRLSWLHERMRRGDTIAILDVMLLPQEAEHEREEFLAEGVRSRLMVPMEHSGRLFGFIGFDVVNEPRDWAQEDIRMLRAAGEIISNAVKRLRAEAAVHSSELQLKEAQHIAHVGNWGWDVAADTIYVSDETYRILGRTPETFEHNAAAFLALVDAADRPAVEAGVQEAIANGTPLDLDLRLSDDEELRVVHLKGQLATHHGSGQQRLVGTVQDVTELRQAERELQRLNRALRTISRGNETLVRATDEMQLLNDICNVLVESGGYSLAWVGYPQQDAARSIKPVAYAGNNEGYLEEVRFGWGDDELGSAHVGKAIRDGAAVITHDVSNDPDFVPWRDAALKRGYSSIIALPLRYGDDTVGVLVIDSAEAEAFDAAEVDLLTELANDLAFGIANLRGEARRLRAEQNLVASEERYHRLYEDAPNAYASVSAADGSLLQCNVALEHMLGYSRDELMAMKVFQLYADMPDGLPRAKEVFASFRNGEAIHDVELQMQRKDGRVVWVSVSVEPVVSDSGDVVESRSSIIDISARKQVEEERKRIGSRLQRALVQTIQAIAVTIEKRDPYTAGHQQRVAELAMAIADELGLDKERIEGLRLGALIHDIGKIYVPAEFLNRPGHLSTTEFEIIQSHPEMGYDIVKGIEFPWPVAEMVVQHHERLNGSGYPHGLTGNQILLEARILSVADVVEAMASHRPYRAALPLEMALTEIETHKGDRYDPEVVDACLRLFREQGFTWRGLLSHS